MRQTGLIAVGWLLLGGLLWLGFDHYLNPNAQLAASPSESGEVVLKRGPDGHFRAPGQINGIEVNFLVDTGATEVALPEAVAARLNLDRGIAMSTHTANGEAIAYATRNRIDRISLGGLTAHDVAASIVPGMNGNEALLGMSFLSRFEIIMNGDEMRIRARQ